MIAEPIQNRTVDLAHVLREKRALPLVVDLDGTLTPTDTLLESAIRLVKQRPRVLWRLPLWLAAGRAHLKARIAEQVQPDVALLPLNVELLDYLRSEAAHGRRLVLATAAHRSIAEQMAARLALFDCVLASDEEHNLKGAAKLRAIQAEVGAKFAYAGDSAADVPIWQNAEAAVLVNVDNSVARKVRAETAVEREFPRKPASLREWVRALRCHQWLKNLLLFVPLLTSFGFFDTGKVVGALLAFAAFSLTASATYLLNDLWDLDNDRAHPRKQLRPLASGRIPIPSALTAAAITMAAGLACAAAVSLPLLGMVLGYVVLTTAYSLHLKRRVLIDVLTLAALYTWRIVAGAIAVNVATSSWLLAFSVFLFFSLALVKRCSELVSLQQTQQDATVGRDYHVTDLAVLWPTGVGTGISAVVVFGLFISSPDVQANYKSPLLMWFVGYLLMYWIARMWLKAARGQMHDDPLVFSLRDRGSRFVIVGMIAATLAARFVTLG